MSITVGSYIEIQLRHITQGIQMMNTFQYAVFELAGIPSAVNYGEAWWNAMKTTTRGLVAATYGDVFQSVVVRELNNPTGEYGEFDIPPGEKAGTRSNPAQVDRMPPYVCAGVRLTVSSRATRPGQKRIPWLCESDQANGSLDTGFRTLTNSWCNVITAPYVLGAPALGVTLTPIITRKDQSGTVVAAQAVTGYVVNQYVTTQNSRKYGRGI